MIKLDNPQNLEIYTAFNSEFRELLNNINPDSISTILGLNMSHKLSLAVTISNDPFATNTKIKPFIIVMNESICNDLNLTQRERFAMISHEIGHILDPTPRINNEMQREINADMFAVKLGFKQDLINGLIKIIISGNYASQVVGIQERICHLKIIKG